MRRLLALILLLFCPAASGPPPQTPVIGIVVSGGTPIAFAELGSTNTTTGATSYVTSASATPTANALLLAFVIITDTAPVGNPTLNGTSNGFTGHGKTNWTDIANVGFNDESGVLHRLYIFRYMSASPEAGTCTFFWSAGGLGCSIQVVEFQNAATGGTEGSGAVVQVIGNVAEATADPNVTLAALASGSAVAVVVGDDVNSTTDIAPEASWTELREFAYGTPNSGSAYIYRLDTSDNTVTTTATSRDWGIAAVEVLKSGSTPATSYILNETFDTSVGYDNAGWSEQGTVNEDYTATILEGTQSLFIDGNTTFSATDFDWFTTLETFYFYCRLRFNSLPGAGAGEIVRLMSADEALACRVFINNDGTLNADSESVFTSNTVGTMSVNTTYHLWVQGTKGSGANAFLNIGFSTDGTRPTSGDNYAEITNGAMTQRFGILRLEAQNSANWDIIFDRVLVDNVQIGNNP